MTYSLWARFVFATSGCFYALMTFSVFCHEALGHGVAMLLCGADTVTVSVRPGFAGFARAGGSSYGPGCEQFVRYAGIGVNVLIGLGALSLLRFRRPRLRPVTLPLFWLAVTQTGQGVGYTLQGLLVGEGDARQLPEVLGPIGRWVAVLILIGLFLLLARWALGTIVGFVQAHYHIRTQRQLRRAFLASFTVPIGLFVLLYPGLPSRTMASKLSFDGGILLVAVVGSLLVTRRLPATTKVETRPITWPATLSWLICGGVLVAFTAMWLRPGVRIG